MTEHEILEIYTERFNSYLSTLVIELESYIKDIVKDCPRIDRVVARAKSIKSFTKKALKEKAGGVLEYTYPFVEIQDQIGVRIICLYKSDVECIKKKVKDYFTELEEKYIQPEDPNQFGYEGIHFIFYIPSDIRNPRLTENECPKVFELQIKTLYQHAWAEANHDLEYKPEVELSKDQKRKIAFTAAQSWGADEIFDDLFTHLEG